MIRKQYIAFVRGVFYSRYFELIVEHVLNTLPHIISRERLEEQQNHDKHRNKPENRIVRKRRSLLTGPVLLEQPGAVRPELNLKNRKTPGLAKLNRVLAEKGLAHIRTFQLRDESLCRPGFIVDILSHRMSSPSFTF